MVRSRSRPKRVDRPWRESVGFQEDLLRLADKLRKKSATLSHNYIPMPQSDSSIVHVYHTESAETQAEPQQLRDTLKSYHGRDQPLRKRVRSVSSTGSKMSSNGKATGFRARPLDDRHQKQIDFIQRMYEEVVIDPQRKKRAVRKSIDRRKQQAAQEVVDKVQNYQRRQ